MDFFKKIDQIIFDDVERISGEQNLRLTDW